MARLPALVPFLLSDVQFNFGHTAGTVSVAADVRTVAASPSGRVCVVDNDDRSVR